MVHSFAARGSRSQKLCRTPHLFFCGNIRRLFLEDLYSCLISWQNAYRIAGGAPAGIIKLPGDDSCRTMRTIMSIMTMMGNNSTAPSGTEIFELPFSRMRLLTKDNRGMILSFSLVRSAREGRLGVDGILFTRFWTNPMLLQARGGLRHEEQSRRQCCR